MRMGMSGKEEYMLAHATGTEDCGTAWQLRKRHSTSAASESGVHTTNAVELSDCLI